MALLLNFPFPFFQSSNNSLVFMEEEVGTLDFYLHGLRRRSQRKKSIARKNAQLFKTITTGDKEALIFPLETDSELCRLICMAFINHKQHFFFIFRYCYQVYIFVFCRIFSNVLVVVIVRIFRASALAPTCDDALAQNSI